MRPRSRMTTSARRCVRPLWPGALVLVFAVCGCVTPIRRVEPEVSPDAMGGTPFLHYLAATSVVTVDEGARAALMLAGHDTGSNRDARWALLRSRGMVRESWNLTPESVLDHGTFAYMLGRVLEIDPGVNGTLAAWLGVGQRRAAMRTAVYKGLLDHAPAHQPIPGGVVIAALARADSGRKH